MDAVFDVRQCRVCLCTDEETCPGGCYWVEEDLCSQCAAAIAEGRTKMFSRKAFEANAERIVKQCLPESHRIALDGKMVVFNHEDYFKPEELIGRASYKADGEDWYLYPIYPSWCIETETNNEQMSLF